MRRIVCLMMVLLMVSAVCPTLAENAGTAGQQKLPALRLAYRKLFPFGTSVTYTEAINTKRMAFYISQFNILTPGNELKPDSVLDIPECKRLSARDDTAVAVHFDAARPMMIYAQASKTPVHGHVLVWHQQTPEAFFHERYDVSRPLVTRKVMLKRLENYIKAVVTGLEEKYPGVIVSWDVVNEAVEDGKHTLRPSRWTEVIGNDFVVRAFEYARKYAPEGVRLFYNDYNTAYEPKQSGIVGLLKALQKAGTCDGYGIQMHHEIRQPGYPAIEKAFRRIAALGLRLRISELDVGIPEKTEDNLEAQAKLYGQIMRLAVEFADQVDAVQVWGVTDDLSWRTGQNPLLFNSDFSPKPAFYAVVEAADQK